MELDWGIVPRIWPLLVSSARMTVLLTILSLALGTIGGLGLALMRMSKFPILRYLAVGYVAFFRSIPLLFMLFFAFFGLPLLGVNMSPLVAAIVVISLDTAYYKAEIIRSGILSVPRGQQEAAEALGMTRRHSMRRIVFPQALRIMIPPYFNSAMLVLKATSLAGVITVAELTGIAGRLISTTFQPIEILTVISLMYLLFTGLLALAQRAAEKRYGLRT